MSKNKISGISKHNEKIRIEYAKKNNKLIESISNLNEMNIKLERELVELKSNIKTKDLVIEQKNELIERLLNKLGWNEEDAVRILYPIENLNKMLGLMYRSLGFKNFIQNNEDLDSLIDSYKKLDSIL